MSFGHNQLYMALICSIYWPLSNTFWKKRVIKVDKEVWASGSYEKKWIVFSCFVHLRVQSSDQSLLQYRRYMEYVWWCPIRHLIFLVPVLNVINENYTEHCIVREDCPYTFTINTYKFLFPSFDLNLFQRPNTFWSINPLG